MKFSSEQSTRSSQYFCCLWILLTSVMTCAGMPTPCSLDVFITKDNLELYFNTSKGEYCIYTMMSFPQYIKGQLHYLFVKLHNGCFMLCSMFVFNILNKTVVVKTVLFKAMVSYHEQVTNLKQTSACLYTLPLFYKDACSIISKTCYYSTSIHTMQQTISTVSIPCISMGKNRVGMRMFMP